MYKVRLPSQPAESVGGNILRQSVRSTANTLSGIVATPFEILSGIGNVLGLEQANTLPTAETFKNLASKALPEGYLNPQNEYEEFSDKVFSDIGRLLSPAGIGGRTLSAGRALAGSALGNFSAEVAKKAGFKETGQALSKVGGLLIGTTAFPNLRNIDKQFYKNAENLISDESVYNAPRLGIDASKVRTLNKRGYLPLNSDSKFFIDKIASEGGPIKIKDAIDLKQSINSELSNATKIQQKYLSPLRDSLNKTIQEYGKNVNPEFLTNWNAAEDIYANLARINPLTKFIQDNVTVNKLSNPLTLGLLGVAGYVNPQAAALGIGSVKGFEALSRAGDLFYRSPTIRKIFGDIFKDSLKKNATLLNRDILKLDQELNKMTQNNEKKFKIRLPS